MKILYLSGALLPSEISHSLSIMRMCQAFTDSGHEVLLTGRGRRGDPRDPVVFYGLRGGFSVVLSIVGRLLDNRLSRLLLIPGFVLAWKTRKLLTSFAPDFVYSRLTLTELALVPRHVPIVYEMHSLGFLRGSRLQRLAFRRLLRRKNVRRIIVTTNMLAGMLRPELPGIDVVVARLSAEHPVSVPETAQEAFRNTNLEGCTFGHHVGYTGYLDTGGFRGTEIICQTAARMPDVAFHIVGGEHSIVEHWRDYAEAHNCHRNIFFYGHRSPSEMPFFLGNFDVVLAPLQYKTSARAPKGAGMSPLKLPQYMSYGKAIVASDIPSHREVLTNDETALLVPPRDIDAWVEAVRSLLCNQKRRIVLGQNAVKSYWEGYSPEIRVQRILAGLSIAADQNFYRATKAAKDVQ